MRVATLALVLGLCAAALPARAEDAAIGFVKTLHGHATLTRGGGVQDVFLGTPLQEADTVETSADAWLGITFRDNTRIALGPGSRLELTRFVFKPADKEYGFILALVKGTLECITGLTAKLAPQAMTVTTPTGTIGVRGTTFVARAED